MKHTTILTGGSGRLGSELQCILPNIIAPSSSELDITSIDSVMNFFEKERPHLVVHAAAYTDVKEAETNHSDCWKINVEGTRNIARVCQQIGAKLLHISTDYVFDGEIGNYSEANPLGPVVNYYSLTKLVAEEAVRTVQNHLIVRTSFRPREFQYPVAFSDVFTSQDYVDIIAPMISEVILKALEIDHKVLHVATERKSVYELAQRRNPNVKEGMRSEAAVRLPYDVSLNTELWQQLRESWRNCN